MLYHQKSFAAVNDGSRFFAASHIFSPPTRWFDCRHSHTSARSRKYQPLPTHPCSRGIVPVVNVDCTEQVTAGKMVSRGRCPPASFNLARFGVASPIRSLESPTTSRTTVRLTRAATSLLG